jgi:hypothetical protein
MASSSKTSWYPASIQRSLSSSVRHSLTARTVAAPASSTRVSIHPNCAVQSCSHPGRIIDVTVATGSSGVGARSDAHAPSSPLGSASSLLETPMPK